MHLSARLVRGPPDSVLSLLTLGAQNPHANKQSHLWDTWADPQ